MAATSPRARASAVSKKAAPRGSQKAVASATSKARWTAADRAKRRAATVKRAENRRKRRFSADVCDDRRSVRPSKPPARSFDGDERPRRARHETPTRLDPMSWEQRAEVQSGSGTTKFADLGLPTPIVKALSGQGITEPFTIQTVTIPDALAGRDVLARAETGSGKTLGFGLPLLARLNGQRGGRDPRGLILVPTRELAVQVADALAPLATSVGLRMALVAGGMSYGPQRKAFERGVDLVVATPGRLIDLLDQAVVDLSTLEVAVLDEADHMADLGFLPDVRRILDQTPPTGQRLLFSATLDNAVSAVVKEYMHDPVTHEVDSGNATVTTMTHRILQVEAHDKGAVTAQIANRAGRTLVFVRTQRGADRVAATLRERGVMAAALHGGQTQGMRLRVLNAFKNELIPVLIATDVAARGIHVDDVSLVLQLDPPANTKDYLHRAGRTARAGAEGQVVTLAAPHQRKLVSRLVKDAGVNVTPRRVTSGGDLLEELTGGQVPTGKAVTDEELSRLLAPPKPTRAPRAARGAWGRGGGKPRRRSW